MTAIVVTQLGKAYKQYPNRWARLAEWLVPGGKPRHVLKWAMQDVNFTVNPGEAVGIIGINGAGKSTLLKMITGITQPTTGSVAITGRIAALLELGIGFHPDFTGRQNAYMAGQLLGYSPEEITELMPQIEAFAEIGDYIDQPVRVYSSGMHIRLAFSVAIAKRPDVLIVDEALAVGDIHFQQKCYERIQEYSKAGTTLLFVTHGMTTVLEVCSRVIYLRHGRVVHDGSPKEAVDLYQADLLTIQDKGAVQPNIVATDTHITLNAQNVTHPPSLKLPEGKAGSLTTEVVTCTKVELSVRSGDKKIAVVSEEEIVLTINYLAHRNLTDPHAGFKIRNKFGVVLFETNTFCMRQSLGPTEAGNELVVQFAFPINLAHGDYTITVGLGNEGYGTGQFRETLSYLHDVLPFTVLLNPASIVWTGIVQLHPRLK